MKFEIRRSFEKDAEKLTVTDRQRVALIFDEVAIAKKISDLKSCKKLSGHHHAYRIRLGSYRIGFFFEDNTIEFVRVLHEKIYTSIFPDM